MTIKFRLLFIVLSCGLLLILLGDLLSPGRWAWLTHPSIPQEKTEIRPLEQREYYPKLDQNALKNILDNSYWNASDYPAWQNMINILRDESESELEKYSFGRITYVQLKSQPKEFRGILVNVRGNAHQCIRVNQDEKKVGIPQIYQIALSPDSSPSEPIVLNVINVPAGFPQGEQIAPQRIECTGFFVKRWAYVAPKDVLTAPLILAKTIKWIPPLPENQASNPPYGLLLLISFVVALIIFFATQWYMEKSLPPKPEKIAHLPSDFAPLNPDNSKNPDNSSISADFLNLNDSVKLDESTKTNDSNLEP